MYDKNEEVRSFLESIPEWAEYYANDLQKVIDIENKPLCEDPKNASSKNNDDDMDFLWKLKGFGNYS